MVIACSRSGRSMWASTLKACSARRSPSPRKRVVEVLRTSGPVAVSALPARVFEAVASFSAYGQEDDVTLLVLRGRSRVAVAA